MSAKLRAAAESLRAKYARTFGIPIEAVLVAYHEDGDVTVGAEQLPYWSLGTRSHQEPRTRAASGDEPK